MLPVLTRLDEIENKLDMLLQEQQTYRGSILDRGSILEALVGREEMEEWKKR